MNYLITGAGGFVGSALSKKLSSQGHKVYAMYISSKEYERNNANSNLNIVPFICDLSNHGVVDDIDIKDEVDRFIHLAWMGISRDDCRNIDIQKSNIQLTLNAVSLAEKSHAKRFVFCGTNQEYLVDHSMVDNSLSPASIYGVCKLCARKLSQALCKDKMEFCSTAFSNVFGVGDYSKRTTNLFIHKLLLGEKLSLIKGENLYDWIYIDDAVDGLIQVSQNGISGKQYYIGSRKLRPFKSIITELRDIVSPETELDFGTFNDSSYTDYSSFDLDALYNDTGFECKADFKASILKTTEWVKSLDWDV